MSDIKILLVDDHTIFRQGMKMLLETQENFLVVGEASDGQEAIKKMRVLNPDIVLMDIAMPDMDGLMTTKEMLKELPDIKIILLTQHENKEYILSGIKMGAIGYIVKRAAADEVVSAIKNAVQGNSFLSPEVANILVDQYRQDTNNISQDILDKLTEREKEILVLVAKGHTNREIGKILYISANTVDFHRTNFMRKLDLHSKIEVTKFAIKKGLIDP